MADFQCDLRLLDLYVTLYATKVCLKFIVMHRDTLLFFCVPDWYSSILWKITAESVTFTSP